MTMTLHLHRILQIEGIDSKLFFKMSKFMDAYQIFSWGKTLQPYPECVTPPPGSV